MTEDDRYVGIVREQGEFAARIKALENKWDQLHSDLREIRDLIRQSSQPKSSATDLALHHLADVLAKQQAQQPSLAQELAALLHTQKPQSGGGNAMAFGFGASVIVALIIGWKLFVGG